MHPSLDIEGSSVLGLGVGLGVAGGGAVHRSMSKGPPFSSPSNITGCSTSVPPVGVITR